MYLFWKRTSLGVIQVSQQGICDFVSAFCEKPFKCTQATLTSADGTLFIVVTKPSEMDPSITARLEAKLRSAFQKMGFSVRVSWVETTKSVSVPETNRLVSIISMPLIWAIAFAFITLLLKEGVSALLWSLFWGVIIVAGVLYFRSPKGAGLIRYLRSRAGR